MSIGGKLVLLGAVGVVVMLVVVYGGGPQPAEAGGEVISQARPPATVKDVPPREPLRTDTTSIQIAVQDVEPVTTPHTARGLVDTARAVIEMGGGMLATNVIPSGFEEGAAGPAQASSSAPVLATQPEPPDTVTVLKGDTLIAIAARVYGDGSNWRRLLEANPGLDPRRLSVGRVLKVIPSEGPIQKTAIAPAQGRSHTVSDGDSLSSIAADYFGDAGRWTVIHEANRGTLGDDPDSLRVGQTLVIP